MLLIPEVCPIPPLSSITIARTLLLDYERSIAAPINWVAWDFANCFALILTLVSLGIHITSNISKLDQERHPHNAVSAKDMKRIK